MLSAASSPASLLTAFLEKNDSGQIIDEISPLLSAFFLNETLSRHPLFLSFL
jgi:hypothetical protein